LASNSDLSSNLIQYQRQSCNITLRRLHIRLNQTCFLENLVEYVPNLEQMSFEFYSSLKFNSLWKSNVETLKKSNENWFKKIPKLQYFSLKTFIFEDMEFVYLKWLLNNFNYVEKLQLHLKKRYACFNKSDLMMSSEILFKMRLYKGIDIPFRNVTKIQFGTCFDRMNVKRKYHLYDIYIET
ncbi:unnamed protein product, partial [Didymodactylos carnosus]